MGSISVVFCFDDNFCSLAAGAISSLIMNTSEKNTYDIYIVQHDISEVHKYQLIKINEKQNININFIDFDINKIFDGKKPYIGQHYSVDMYTRLFLHRILPGLDRVLYLDADIIINSDIADLYQIDIGKYSLAAVGLMDFWYMDDPQKLKRVTFNRKHGFDQYESIYEYLLRHLKLNEKDMVNFFSSGAILYNLKKAAKVLDNGLKEIINNKYLWPDMDILNILFKGDVFKLDRKFCIVPERVFEFINERGMLPDIIHYNGPNKPNKSMTRVADISYWESLSNTDFFYSALDVFLINKFDTLFGQYLQHKETINAFNKQIDKFLQYPETIRLLNNQIRKQTKLKRKRKLINLIIKPLVSQRKYQKLKRDPTHFFNDSKSKFIHFLSKWYF